MRLLAVATLLALTATGCRQNDEAAASTARRDSAPPVHVTTAPVTEQPMPEYLTLTGTLRANSESDIAADVSGKVIQTLVERGQPVKRGQMIALIDARSAALAATAAEAQSKVAQSQLEEARRDCERVKHLLDTGAISQADYDRQTATCTSQQWSAAAAEAQQQSATKLLGDARIRAPFDGIIGERFVNTGQYVQPNTRVASIYVPDPLRLEVTVPEANVGAIQQDMPIDFSVTAYGNQTFTGHVKYVSPNIREATRDLVVEALVPNADLKVKPGMFAMAKIALASKPHSVVPRSAVVQDDSGARLFVVLPPAPGAPDGHSVVQERMVQLGETSGDNVAVLGGVKPGEIVVVQPGPNLRDGARVE